MDTNADASTPDTSSTDTSSTDTSSTDTSSTDTSSTDTNPVKDPDQWTTGDEPMTGPQESYLSTLAQEAGEDVPDELTKAEASKKIDELQERTGRGTD